MATTVQAALNRVVETLGPIIEPHHAMNLADVFLPPEKRAAVEACCLDDRLPASQEVIEVVRRGPRL